MGTAWLDDILPTLIDRQVDLDGVLRRIVDETTRRLAADRGTLYLVDHATQELVSRVAHLPEIAEIRLRLGEGVAGWVGEHDETVRIGQTSADPRFQSRFDALTGYRTTSMLVVPVRHEGTVLGVLQILNKSGGDFTAEDATHASAIADHIPRILDATSLRSQLRPASRQPLAFRFNHIVGESAPMQSVYGRLQRAAATDVTVLVRGETGTGKELIARAIHFNSGRRDSPLVKVDCAALPENLIENELFGHERGAFTGADRRTTGKVHAAEGGTLFLDEIGELSLPVQGKLLRLLQERSFLRVGSTVPEKADIRFVCATHRELAELVEAGDFRRDLYYRLRVVEILSPPLRARGHGDLDRLIDHFVYEFTRRHVRPDLKLTSDARSRLHAWPWPGNVRELEHCIESAVVLTPGNWIRPEHLPLEDTSVHGTADADDGFWTSARPLKEVERDYVQWVVEQCGGNRTAAARLLNIGRNTLARKLSS